MIHARPRTRHPFGRIAGRCLLALTVAIPLTSCSTASAPAVVLFGAYFPDWLVFALLAMVVAIAARIAIGVAGLTPSIPFLLGTCLAVGILVAGAIDLLWLNR